MRCLDRFGSLTSPNSPEHSPPHGSSLTDRMTARFVFVEKSALAAQGNYLHESRGNRARQIK
jgi:hypothetical protein